MIPRNHPLIHMICLSRKLEHDYNAGTTWCDNSKISSASDAPPQIDKYKLHVIPKKHGKGDAWLNMSALAHELRVPFKTVETAVQNLAMDLLPTSLRAVKESPNGIPDLVGLQDAGGAKRCNGMELAGRRKICALQLSG